MFPFSKKRHPVTLLFENMTAVIGVVLIWRGIWYLLDQLDVILFGGSAAWTAIGGIIVGMLLLYIPDKNFKELEKH